MSLDQVGESKSNCSCLSPKRVKKLQKFINLCLKVRLVPIRNIPSPYMKTTYRAMEAKKS